MASPSTTEDSGAARHVEFEASIFSALESNLASPLSLNLPPFDVKFAQEKSASRHDSKVSHRSLHRSSSLVFRTLPPIRRMPSLQVPSLTDITNPHLSSARRSLHQISETEPSTYKLKLPLTLVHPNSPYSPRPQMWYAEESAESDPQPESEDKQVKSDKKPIRKHLWTAIKYAPRNIKTRCQRLLNAKAKDTLTEPQNESAPDNKEQLVAYTPCSPTASFMSTDTNTLAVWLAERQRRFAERDCESGRIMSIEEYEQVGSWVRPKETTAFCSRSSYHHSFIDGDTNSSIFVLESEHDLTLSPVGEHSLSPARPPSHHSNRPAFGTKRISEEDRLSRMVHRSSLRSYIAERSMSITNAHQTIPVNAAT
ncbi:hypothetical protein FA15DRAFT_662628 [Coprinopsis marcescibilis]|uniref:Uncharacterized protein n=1 Tax=Coprinopsis marcescibilis TaxID=230819 RepID=A0A5C3LPG9_COPMA|nr:hypothetical protein FA15DRAFT_662628 [Coprinopsis marcescibilis]